MDTATGYTTDAGCAQIEHALGTAARVICSRLKLPTGPDGSSGACAVPVCTPTGFVPVPGQGDGAVCGFVLLHLSAFLELGSLPFDPSLTSGLTFGPEWATASAARAGEPLQAFRTLLGALLAGPEAYLSARTVIQSKNSISGKIPPDSLLVVRDAFHPIFKQVDRGFGFAVMASGTWLASGQHVCTLKGDLLPGREFLKRTRWTPKTASDKDWMRGYSRGMTAPLGGASSTDLGMTLDGGLAAFRRTPGQRMNTCCEAWANCEIVEDPDTRVVTVVVRTRVADGKTYVSPGSELRPHYLLPDGAAPLCECGAPACKDRLEAALAAAQASK